MVVSPLESSTRARHGFRTAPRLGSMLSVTTLGQFGTTVREPGGILPNTSTLYKAQRLLGFLALSFSLLSLIS
jgi:hypothetical protein